MVHCIRVDFSDEWHTKVDILVLLRFDTYFIFPRIPILCRPFLCIRLVSPKNPFSFIKYIVPMCSNM